MKSFSEERKPMEKPNEEDALAARFAYICKYYRDKYGDSCHDVCQISAILEMIDDDPEQPKQEKAKCCPCRGVEKKGDIK